MSSNINSRSSFWTQHYENVSCPRLSPGPRSSEDVYSRYCEETWEPLTDLPYSVLSDDELDLPEPSQLRGFIPPQTQPLACQDNRPHLPSISTLLTKDQPSTSPRKSTTAPASEKENQNSKSVGSAAGSRASKKPGAKAWTAGDLILLARAVVELKPFLSPYGKKGKAWEEVRSTLVRKEGFRLTDVAALGLHHKAEHLVGYWKNRDSADAGVKAVAKVLRGSTDEITIAALLDRVEAQYDEAKDKSDEAKEKIRKKQEDDSVGGEAIRTASMQAMRAGKGRSRPGDSSDNETNSDENDSESGRPVKRKLLEVNSSMSSLDNEDAERSRKRKRSSIRRTSTSTEILSFLKNDSEDRKVHQGQVVTLLKSAEQRGTEMTRIMQGFLELDRARFEHEKNV